jgi:hypothetical protein
MEMGKTQTNACAKKVWLAVKFKATKKEIFVQNLK